MDPIRTGQEVITPVTKAIIEDIQLLKESQMHHPCISFHISKKVRYIEWMINLTSSVLSHDICFKDMIGSVSPSNLVISRQYHLKFIFHRDINRVSIMLCRQTTACLPLSSSRRERPSHHAHGTPPHPPNTQQDPTPKRC